MSNFAKARNIYFALFIIGLFSLIAFFIWVLDTESKEQKVNFMDCIEKVNYGLGWCLRQDEDWYIGCSQDDRLKMIEWCYETFVNQ